MDLWHYEHCGLVVASELAVPELDPLRNVTAGRADVHVRVEEVAAGAAEDRPMSVFDGECRFSAVGAGEYIVRGGCEIVVHPCPFADPRVLRLFLLGSAWGAILHQRGAFALHAGVTADGHGAIAFCGPPSAGKSSTVAWLLRRGHTLVSDDLCRMEVSAAAPPMVWASGPRLKLSGDALEAMGLAVEAAAPELPDRKFQVPWDAARTGKPLPLRAVYVLSWGAPGLRRLQGAEAVQRFLAAATYRSELFDSAAELAAHWQRCVEVARRVPIWALGRGRDWSSMEQVMEQLVPSGSPAEQ